MKTEKQRQPKTIKWLILISLSAVSERNGFFGEEIQTSINMCKDLCIVQSEKSISNQQLPPPPPRCFLVVI